MDGKPSPEQLSSKLRNIQYLKCAQAHGGGLSSAGMKFSLSASQLLAFDPRLQGKTPATTAITISGSGEGWAALLAKVKQCE